MSVKQISVFLENRPGALCEMTRVLGENAIDMRAFSLAETSDFGIARVIVDEVYKTLKVADDAKAEQALRTAGVRLVEQEELSEL